MKSKIAMFIASLVLVVATGQAGSLMSRSAQVNSAAAISPDHSLQALLHIPEPGIFATLLVCVLVVGVIVRRRLSS